MTDILSQITNVQRPADVAEEELDKDGFTPGQQLGYDFNRYPTLLRLAHSKARVRIVTGPAGSSKTTGLIWYMIMLALSQKPDNNGVRRSMGLVVRNTVPVLRSSTIMSFKEAVGPLLTFKTGSFPMKAFLRCSLADGTSVHCDFEFISFQSEDDQSKLLGYQPTFAFLDEVSELPESLIQAVSRRLGRYPNPKYSHNLTHNVVLGATNGPKKNHWLYRWSMGEKDAEFKMMAEQLGQPYFEFFKQPAGLLRPREEGGRWLPNPMAENIENLPNGYGYYYAMLGDADDKIKAYVEGDFSDIKTGKVVFPEFREDLHVLKADTPIPTGIPLILGFDFGRTPVCIIAVANTGGRVIIVDEVVGEDMSIETLYLEHVASVLKSARYSRSWIENAWGDPAGEAEAQSVDLSPYDILVDNGVPIENPGSNKIGVRIEAVRQMLNRIASDGKPMLQITANCRYTIEAFKNDYIYESVRGKNDVVRDVPTKSHVNWVSDLMDAVQYICLGYGSMYRAQKRRNRFPSSRRTTRYI